MSSIYYGDRSLSMTLCMSYFVAFLVTGRLNYIQATKQYVVSVHFIQLFSSVLKISDFNHCIMIISASVPECNKNIDFL